VCFCAHWKLRTGIKSSQLTKKKQQKNRRQDCGKHFHNADQLTHTHTHTHTRLLRLCLLIFFVHATLTWVIYPSTVYWNWNNTTFLFLIKQIQTKILNCFCKLTFFAFSSPRLKHAGTWSCISVLTTSINHC